MIPDIYMCGIMAQSASMSAIAETVGDVLRHAASARSGRPP